MKSKSTSSEMRCIVCDSPSISVFLENSEMPIHCNVLYKKRKTALEAPIGDIELGFCGNCGHIFNIAFQPSKIKYDQEYENSLHYSSTFQDYAKSLAINLIQRYNLYGKNIIDIGCGKGDFIRLMSELGGNRGIGFDESYEYNRNDQKKTDNVTFIQDLYSERYADCKADMISCRHVLEHIQHPKDFLISLRHALGDNIDTILFFEVPSVNYTLMDLGIWDIIYEHVSYFSAGSLLYLFNLCGFKVLNVNEAFGGQFLCIEATPAENSKEDSRFFLNNINSIKDNIETFTDTYLKKTISWKDKLNEIENQGKRTVVWGSGSKGVTFLNTFKIMNFIKYVVDINPYKMAKHVPVTGQEIIKPESLQSYIPEMIIVMNPIYVEEIRRIMRGLNISAELLIA